MLAGGLILVAIVVVLSLFVVARPSPPSVEPVPTTSVAVAEAPAVPTMKPTSMPTPDASIPTPVANGSTPQALDVQVVPVASPTPYGWWDMTNQFDASLDADVRDAYNRYWQARVDAAYNLDPSLLPQVEANPWLAMEQAALNDMRTAGTARKVEANHSLRVRYATESEALILDDYSLQVETLDATTKEPVSDAASAIYRTVTRMQKLDGAWKAVDEVQVTSS
jgi:hypothetical protein